MAFKYVHSNDDKAVVATSVVATTEDTTYPATNIRNQLPSKPSKLTGTTGNWVFSFDAAVSIDVVALINHNLTAGLDVRIQGNATNVWTSPTLNQSITIPTWRGDGFATNAFLDLTGIGSRSFQYWRLLVNAANGAPCAIGECVLGGTLRTLSPRGIAPGAVRIERRPLNELKTDAGISLRYDLGQIERELRATHEADATTIGSVQAWWRSCKGRASPSLIIPDHTINDPWYALFGEPELSNTRNAPGSWPMDLVWVDMPRGLAL